VPRIALENIQDWLSTFNLSRKGHPERCAFHPAASYLAGSGRILITPPHPVIPSAASFIVERGILRASAMFMRHRQACCASARWSHAKTLLRLHHE